jgi:hypothetical protein
MRKNCYFSFSMLFLSLFALSDISRASDGCDPASFKDIKVSYKEDWTKILYVHDVITLQQRSSESSGGLDIFDIAKLTGDSKRTYADQLYNLLNVNYESVDKRYLFLMGFSEEGKQAYEKCLENSPQISI